MVQETGNSSVGEILARVVDKMIRRHPHVFGDVSVADDKEVIENWTKIKASEEKIKMRKSVLDGIPRSLPALNRAQKISSRASQVGFDWVDVKDMLPKIDEEIQEFKEALETEQIDHIRNELGDILFVMVNVGRKLGINSEACLNETTDKFESRFKHIEQQLAKEDKTWPQTTLDEMERYWNEAKELKKHDLK
jgi:MazG family protein